MQKQGHIVVKNKRKRKKVRRKETDHDVAYLVKDHPLV